MRTHVENLTNTNGNKVANQFRIDIWNKRDHDIIFQSYDSEIIRVNSESCTIFVGADFGYSKTTTKYTKIFLNDVFTNDFGADVYTAIKNELDKIEVWKIVRES